MAKTVSKRPASRPRKKGSTSKSVKRRVKKSASSFGGLAVLISSVCLIIFIVFISIGIKNRSDNASAKANQDISLALLTDQVKILLFDHEISRSSIQEEIKQDSGRDVVKIVVKAPSNSHKKLKKAVLKLFAQHPVKVTDGKDIVVDSDSYRMTIAFLDDTPVSPAKTDKPPVNQQNNQQANQQTVVVPTDSTKKDPVKTAQTNGAVVAQTAIPKPPTPPKRGSGKIAILIDDAGNNTYLAEKLASMKQPITFAVLPHLSASRESADIIRAKGQSVFLHYPMEPKSYPATDPGVGALLTNMPELLIVETTKQNVENIGKIDGANNHMGSAVTEDLTKMTQVMDSLKPYTNTFVDSRTSSSSMAYQVCVDEKMKCGINKKFLDNEDDVNAITARLYEAAELAEKNGTVISIGHLRTTTVAVLEKVIPELQALGYKFVFVKDVVE